MVIMKKGGSSTRDPGREKTGAGRGKGVDGVSVSVSENVDLGVRSQVEEGHCPVLVAFDMEDVNPDG
jgi:hypothetical protein